MKGRKVERDDSEANGFGRQAMVENMRQLKTTKEHGKRKRMRDSGRRNEKDEEGKNVPQDNIISERRRIGDQQKMCGQSRGEMRGKEEEVGIQKGRSKKNGE